MSDMKITLTRRRDWDDEAVADETSYRAAYWIGLAYEQLPLGVKFHFAHIGVIRWLHEPGELRITATFQKAPRHSRTGDCFLGLTPQDFSITGQFKIEHFGSDSQRDSVVPILKAWLIEVYTQNLNQLTEDLATAQQSVDQALALVAPKRPL